ncbi:MAG: DUF1844 domain-containing protein [Planctomycetes bacterium]|nr:DUF1844 domain-containing protein [Planctomycetota bacterium]
MADETATPSPDQRKPAPQPEHGSKDAPPGRQTPGDAQPKQAAAGGSKIHVDTDWKAQARAEKERLAREAEPARAEAGPAPGTAAAGPRAARARGVPAVSFAGLIQMLATQALIFLSDERDPQTGRSLRNLGLAKHNIDMLSVLEEKTRGNLTDEEKRLLDRYLYELRMAYVAAAS